MWLQEVKDHKYGDQLQINWKYFSLEQVNSQNGPDWKVWEQGEDYQSRGNPPFRAAEAARRQSEELFEKVHIAILKARFEDRKNIGDKDVLREIVRAVGVDMERWERDYSDPTILQPLAHDYTSTRETYNTFGVPTIFPGNGRGFYVRLEEVPRGEEAVEAFENFYTMMTKNPYFLEVKQPSYPKRD